MRLLTLFALIESNIDFQFRKNNFLVYFANLIHKSAPQHWFAETWLHKCRQFQKIWCIVKLNKIALGSCILETLKIEAFRNAVLIYVVLSKSVTSISIKLRLCLQNLLQREKGIFEDTFFLCVFLSYCLRFLHSKINFKFSCYVLFSLNK
jgi:hypothetical protein